MDQFLKKKNNKKTPPDVIHSEDKDSEGAANKKIDMKTPGREQAGKPQMLRLKNKRYGVFRMRTGNFKKNGLMNSYLFLMA